MRNILKRFLVIWKLLEVLFVVEIEEIIMKRGFLCLWLLIKYIWNVIKEDGYVNWSR